MRLRTLEKQLQAAGFTLDRINGSHRCYTHWTGRTLVIAAHSSHQMFSHQEQARIWRTVERLLAGETRW